MTVNNKLALVWGDQEGPQIIIPLVDVTDKMYEEYTECLGIPKGRTERFLDLTEYERPESKLERMTRRG